MSEIFIHLKNIRYYGYINEKKIVAIKKKNTPIILFY